MTFQPTGDLAKRIFSTRYAIHPEESWEQASYRVATHVAQVEEDEKWGSVFYDEIVNGRFMPGGRIWFGSGREQGQLLNCFVVPTEDSMEGWAKTIGDIMIISARGGGVGANLSAIRGRGSLVKGNGGVSTGAVSFAEGVNAVGDMIVGGGGRRMALMLCLDINHPDVEEFLSVKLNLKRLNNANISLVLNIDPVEFVAKVRNKEELELEFNGQTKGTINAGWLWDTLVKNAWTSGEPGILNGFLANEQNNIWYHKPLISTNPCGEIWLEAYGCCDLGAIVLHNFVHGGEVDIAELSRTVRVGVRFLDDVLSVNRYPLQELEDNCKQVRRLGLGVMGLHNMLLALGMKYSSPEAHRFIDNIFCFIKEVAYEESVNLAKEKGAFPAFDPMLLESGFAMTLRDELRADIALHGLRNCALLTIAPTGTTSLVMGCSSGIEPLYAPVHIRNYWSPQPDGTKVNERQLVVEPVFAKYGSLVEGAMDISPRNHFEVQRIVQQHIDNAVSKTINLPSDITIEELSDTWLDYLPYLKGTTLYRSGSRGQEPLEYISSDRAEEVMKEWGYVVEEDRELQAAMDCVDGVCVV